MGRNVAVGTILAGWLALTAWVPAGGPDAKPAEGRRAGAAAPAVTAAPEKPAATPEAAVPMPVRDEKPEALRELEDRGEKARAEVQLLEAQLAVKRAEAQKAEAEVRVFLIQNPDLVGVHEEKAVREAIRSDPEVAELMSQIEQLRKKHSMALRLQRSSSDPSVRNAAHQLQTLKDRLQETLESRRKTLILRLREAPPSSPRDAGEVDHPDEVVRR